MSNSDIADFFQNTFKIDIKDETLYQQALTHRSYLNETKKNLLSYERLEFLGDSILSFYVSQIIYQEYPSFPEGDLTNLRSAVVKTDSLAILAKKINLGNFLFLSKGEEESGGRENISILADCFEAIIAAMYLDQGLAKAKDAILPFLIPVIKENFAKKQLKDYKSLLQEVAQEKQSFPLYKVVKTAGPDHHKLFTIAVIINHETISTGEGYSKQKAEQEAARLALEKWQK